MIMKTKNIFILLILLFSINSQLCSQSLTFGYQGVIHEDTLQIGDSIHFNFWIVNQGNSNVDDSININCETFDIMGGSISGMQIGNTYNNGGTIDPGDSIFITITELVTYQSFILGDNIIVIWPALIGPGTSDTSITNIHILDSSLTNLENKNIEENIIIYPNPVIDYFIIHNQLKHPLSSISITDYLGKTIYTKDRTRTQNTIINTNGWKNGTYILKVIIRNKEITKKIFVI